MSSVPSEIEERKQINSTEFYVEIMYFLDYALLLQIEIDGRMAVLSLRNGKNRVY